MAGEIKVGKELQDTLRTLELLGPGAASRALDSQIIPIVVNAKAKWPKKTGLSGGALKIRVENENGRIVKYVEDNVRYAGAVIFKDTEINAAESLVFEPIAKALEPILEQFAREIGKT